MDQQQQIISELLARIARLEERSQRRGAMNQQEAASYLNKSVSWLRDEHKAGRGPKRFKNGRIWTYRTADLDDWLSASTSEAAVT